MPKPQERLRGGLKAVIQWSIGTSGPLVPMVRLVPIENDVIDGLQNEEYTWHVCISTSLYSPIEPLE